MIKQSEIDELQLKLLPEGGERIVRLLATHKDRITIAKIAVEGVPLIILARHGILARLPVNGVMKKLSQPNQVLDAATHFFTGRDTLYLYVNLPELSVPDCVKEVLSEASSHMQSRDELRKKINDALDAGDREQFMRLTAELRAKEHPSERLRFDVRRD